MSTVKRRMRNKCIGFKVRVLGEKLNGSGTKVATCKKGISYKMPRSFTKSLALPHVKEFTATTVMNFDETRDLASLFRRVYPSLWLPCFTRGKRESACSIITIVLTRLQPCGRMRRRAALLAVQPCGDARTRIRRDIESMHRAACRIGVIMYSDVATAIRMCLLNIS